MLMGIKSLAVALVLHVPNSQSFVIGRADDVLSAWVEQQSTDPVIMTDLLSDGKRIQQNYIQAVNRKHCNTNNVDLQMVPVNMEIVEIAAAQ